MKKGPDLIVVLIMVFVVGFAVTTVSHSDLEISQVLTQVITTDAR